MGLRGLRLLLQVTVDQEQPKVLAEALTAIVSPHAGAWGFGRSMGVREEVASPSLPRPAVVTPPLWRQSGTTFLPSPTDPEEETDAGDGVPLGVLLAFLSSDTPDETEVALLIRRRAATSTGPPAVPSPAFERCALDGYL